MREKEGVREREREREREKERELAHFRPLPWASSGHSPRSRRAVSSSLADCNRPRRPTCVDHEFFKKYNQKKTK